MDDPDPPPLHRDVARVLGEHSPRLHITGPTLIPYATSPTGWLLVIPEEAEPRTGR